MDKKSILIFGVGPLQKSIIERCKLKGLFTIGIDPMEDAACKDEVDAFEVVGGQDFEKTLDVAKRYNVKGIITAATDKPLVMMARIAERLNLPFFSIETAEWSTDKLLMKEKFMEADIPCAKGFLLNNLKELENHIIEYPVIVKPRDNSGSRGVIYCNSKDEVESAVKEALQFTNKGSVLVEEFIDGKEYSIEAIHYKDETHVIQITEKITTDFPYNVEIGHIQPADLSADHQDEIKSLVAEIAQALKFDNCASHTEVKINNKGIFVIESSPRLGGDFITSTLVPLSTGLNMEDLLIDILTESKISVNYYNQTISAFSAIVYFNLLEDTKITKTTIELVNKIKEINEVKECDFSLKAGDNVNKITSSLNRYGCIIISSNKKVKISSTIEHINNILSKYLN